MTTADTDPIHAAAARLATAARTGIPCAPVRDLIGSDDFGTAYQVQSLNTDALLASGKRIVGRKIGLTSPAVQKQLGVNQPDFGVLFDDMECAADETVPMTRLLQPRIEAEIAFVLSADIDTEISADDASGYVETVQAAFEIVDSRIAGWDITLSDTVADNASSGLYLLGESRSVAEVGELADAEMTMIENGRQCSQGVGSDCLGSPWNALAWLANTSRSYGSPLRAGEVVLSGALGPVVRVQPGATYTADITGLGSVRATFSH
ncbi:MAG: fumarylacetoacetate hydrolase family protein [Rhodococcus sp. (in: high G+C Gram-positive bacteria)]